MNKPSRNRIIIFVPALIMLLLITGALVVAGFVKKQRTQETAAQEAARVEEKAQETPEPTEIPTPEPTPVVTEPPVTEEPELLVPEEVELPGNGKLIAIDPGHQGHGNSDHEPIGPGASQTKPKVASGTSGRSTGVPEYQLNLDVSLKLRDELEARGYEVYMIRETNDVDISNAERAKKAADAGADILVRIHANGSENSSVAGALTMAPSSGNRFVGSKLAKKCQDLSAVVIEEFCAATGANNQGVYRTDDMSGLNWCTIPATIVEMGYMTNPEEDNKMQTEDYQNLMVQGIANGIDRYFAE